MEVKHSYDSNDSYLTETHHTINIILEYLTYRNLKKIIVKCNKYILHSSVLFYCALNVET